MCANTYHQTIYPHSVHVRHPHAPTTTPTTAAHRDVRRRLKMLHKYNKSQQAALTCVCRLTTARRFVHFPAHTLCWTTLFHYMYKAAQFIGRKCCHHRKIHFHNFRAKTNRGHHSILCLVKIPFTTPCSVRVSVIKLRPLE